LRRAIQSEIEDPLSEMLLREEAQAGDTIVIDVKDGKIEACVQKAATAKGHAATQDAAVQE